MERERRTRLPDGQLHWLMPVDRRTAKAVYTYHQAVFERVIDAEEFNDKLLRLVAICDEKADMVPLDVAGFDPELRWVPVAKAVFRVVGIRHPEIEAHAQARLFSDHSLDTDMQRELYREMCQHLDAEHWSSP